MLPSLTRLQALAPVIADLLNAIGADLRRTFATGLAGPTPAESFQRLSVTVPSKTFLCFTSLSRGGDAVDTRTLEGDRLVVKSYNFTFVAVALREKEKSSDPPKFNVTIEAREAVLSSSSSGDSSSPPQAAPLKAEEFTLLASELSTIGDRMLCFDVPLARQPLPPKALYYLLFRVARSEKARQDHAEAQLLLDLRGDRDR